jgi:hypothetical protein
MITGGLAEFLWQYIHQVDAFGYKADPFKIQAESQQHSPMGAITR